MLKFCLDKWTQNSDDLRDYLMNEKSFDDYEYLDLVKLIVEFILNKETPGDDDRYNVDNITEIDNGDYQGTLLYVIPADTYQPSEWEYIMTCVSYGSCSGCDTLQAILACPYGAKEMLVDDLMHLCRDMVTNIVAPYRTTDHWAFRDEDKNVEVKWED